MDNKVYIVKCKNYEEAGDKVDELLKKVGGMSRFVKKGENIILKANLLQAAKPEIAVTTHPAVVAAAGRLVKQEGAYPAIADSPGAGYKYNKKTLAKTYQASEMLRVAEEQDIEINFDTSHEAVFFEEGKLIKRFEVIRPILEADGVINLCKFKTHLFMHMTGAVKNSFGVIPGLFKPGYHAKLHDPVRFAGMMLDLSAYVAPRLSIMDAVMGLQGEGPGAAGEPRHVGLLLAAVNPLALDVAAGEIMGLKRDSNPVLLEAERRGLLPNRLEDIEIIGPDIEELRIPDFKFPATVYAGTGLGGLPWYRKLLSPLFKPGMSLKPRVMKKKCTACGVCRDSCPVEAITITEKKFARIDEKKCIRCYCCHEMCQFSAIKLHRGLLFRAVTG